MKEPEMDKCMHVMRLQSEIEITLEANSHLLEADRVKSRLIEHLQGEIKRKDEEVEELKIKRKSLLDWTRTPSGIY